MKKRISAAVCFGAMVMAATSTFAVETSKAQPAEVAFEGVTFPALPLWLPY
ncbi:hypothetical protein [Desulfogranum marinum]|uniref:hypothetical protein n=1 Tax=Desulfogranum marinum TaxID=453220 RepID=UPI001963D83F|nr:hypothetical protein [Desulfogranum marinum]MBM9514617.1 hypothetical protein [Desulfogranum marinum]